MTFNLTDTQRDYFGLTPIEPDWQNVQSKDGAVLYFAGNLLRKVICYGYGVQFGYWEMDYNLATDACSALLPATAKGKPKPLSLSNIFARKPSGFCFTCTFGWRGKTVPFQNLRIWQEPSGHELVALCNHGLTNYEALEAWVENYIQQLPADHFQRLAGIANTASKPRVAYYPGDYFEIRFSDDVYGYGRILLDLFRMRRSGMFSDLPRSAFDNPITGSGLLIAIYAYAGPRLEVPEIAAKPVLGTKLLMHDDIFRGRFPIVGNLPVLASDLDFPEGVLSYDPGDGKTEYFFQKGGLQIPLSLSPAEYAAAPKLSVSFALNPPEIWEAIQQKQFDSPFIANDLRQSPQRAAILERCGLRTDWSYEQMVAAKGGISAQQFAIFANAMNQRSAKA